MIYYDVPGVSLASVFMKHSRVITYVSIKLNLHKKNNPTHDLE